MFSNSLFLSQQRTSELAGQLEDDDEEDCSTEFETLVQAYLRDVQYSSRRQAIFSVVYAVFNAGLVALPFVTEQCGIPIYVFSVFFMCVTSGYTASMVVKMANENAVKSMEDLAECAFGPSGFFCVCLLQIIFSFSLMCVSLEVSSDIVLRILDDYISLEDFHLRILAVIGASILVFPFCVIAKSLASLR